MINESFEMILHSLNKEKRMSFLKMSTEYVNNEKKELIFTMKSLNI